MGASSDQASERKGQARWSPSPTLQEALSGEDGDMVELKWYLACAQCTSPTALQQG